MFKKSIFVVITIIVGLIVSILLTSPQSNAFDFYKGKLHKSDAKSSNSEVKASSEGKTVNPAEQVVFQNEKYSYTFSYPGNWILKNDDPKESSVSVVDENGKLGNLSVTSTWMSDNFPVEPALKALLDQAIQRKKHGELDLYYTKNFSIKDKSGKTIDIVKGVVVVESDIDPDYKRMQWQAYGGGNYYNFTACSTVANFPAYKEQFKKIIDSVNFNFKK